MGIVVTLPIILAHQQSDFGNGTNISVMLLDDNHAMLPPKKVEKNWAQVHLLAADQ